MVSVAVTLPSASTSPKLTVASPFLSLPLYAPVKISLTDGGSITFTSTSERRFLFLVDVNITLYEPASVATKVTVSEPSLAVSVAVEPPTATVAL